MIHVEVRCTTCKIPMECIANIKIIGNGSIAHFLFTTSLGGIYECPKCKKKSGYTSKRKVIKNVQ